MKNKLLILLLFISSFAKAQTWGSWLIKTPFSVSDSMLVWNNSTKKFVRVKVPIASSSLSGYLSSSDWTTFNNKASSSDLANYIPLAGTSQWAGNITSNGIRSIGHFDATYPSNSAQATFYGAGGNLYYSQFSAQTANRNAFFRSYNDESNGDLHSIMSVEWAGGDSAKSLIVPKDSAVTIVNDYGRYNKSQSANLWADTLGWANTGWVRRYVSAYGGGGGGGSGTVTDVSVVTANGVSGSVANSTTTPAITLTLGAITPTSVNGVTISGSSTPSLTVVGSSSIAGSNTGDQTSVTGNAGTATALQTARTIGIATGDVTSAGSSFDGTANNTNAYTIANNAVTTAKIADANVTNAKLANSSIAIAGNSTALGGSVTQDQITGLSTTGLVKRTGANTLAIATAGTDYQAPLTLTTTGAIGAASLAGSTLNIPRGIDELSTMGTLFFLTGTQLNSSTGWVSSGGITSTFGSNKIAVSGAVGQTTFTGYTYYSSYVSNNENFEDEWDISPTTTPSATTYGVSIGVRSLASQFKNDFVVKVDFTSSNFGLLSIYQNTNGTFALVKTGENTFPSGAAGDVYRLRIKIQKKGLSATLYGASGSNIGKITSVFSDGQITPNTFARVIYQHGGTTDVTRVLASSNTPVGAEYCFVGMSITSGSSPVNTNYRYADIIGETTKGRYTVFAGPANCSADALTTINETIASAPRRIFVDALGVNDAGFGISQATFQATMNSIHTALTGAGYVLGSTLFYMSVPPRNDISSATITSFNNGLYSAFTAGYIDTWTTLIESQASATALSPKYNSGDNLHWNQYGHQAVAELLIGHPLCTFFVKKDEAKPKLLPLPMSRSATTAIGIPIQTIVPSTASGHSGLFTRTMFSPLTTLGSSYISYGANLQGQTNGTASSYCGIGVLNKGISNVATGAGGGMTVLIGSSSEAAINNTATVTNAIGQYNLVTSLGTTIATNVYSTYSANPNLFTAGLSGVNKFLNYVEDPSVTTTTYLPNGVSFGTGSYTNNWGVYVNGSQASSGYSYIGNGLGVALSSAPTANSSITAALHVGAPSGRPSAYFVGTVGVGVASPTSTFHVNGSASYTINTSAKTTAYTATASDYTITCDATSAGFTVTLPTAIGITGRIYVIKKIDATGNVVTVDGFGSETIDGSTTQSLDSQWESMMIQSNGANWYILSIN